MKPSSSFQRPMSGYLLGRRLGVDERGDTGSGIHVIRSLTRQNNRSFETSHTSPPPPYQPRFLAASDLLIPHTAPFSHGSETGPQGKGSSPPAWEASRHGPDGGMDASVLHVVGDWFGSPPWFFSGFWPAILLCWFSLFLHCAKSPRPPTWL